MGNLLFSPSGRIGSGEFIKAAIILIVIMVLLSVPTILGMDTLEAILTVLSLALIYPWVVIWIKRYHDAGKSGWMCLIPIAAFLIGYIVLFTVLLWDVFAMSIELASQGASEAEIEEQIGELDEAKLATQFTIASTVLSIAVAFLFNAMIKQDSGDNKFGPVPSA